MKDKHLAYEKRAVWEGKKTRTASGLTKSDLAVSKTGQIVSKARQIIGRRRMSIMKREGTAAAPFKKGHHTRKSRH